MKIVLIHRAELHKRPPVISALTNLLDLGIDVSVVTSGINEYYKELLTKKGKEFFVVPCIISRHSVRNYINSLVWGIRVRRLIKKQYDHRAVVLWIEGNYTFSSLGSSFINSYYHILQHQELYDESTRKGRYYKSTISRIISTSLANFVPEYNRAQIYRMAFKLDRLPYVTPNKPAFIPTTLQLQEIGEKYKMYEDLFSKRIVLYQGVITKERNLDSFISAAMRLNQDIYKVVILGQATDYLKNYKRKYPSLAHIPYISAPDYLYITSRAYIGIVTYDTFELNTIYCAPNKIYEYSAFGVPMVGNDIPGLKYTIESSGCGHVCDAKDEDEIYEAFLHIIEHHDEMAKKAIDFFRTIDNKKTYKQALNEIEKRNNNIVFF